MTRSYNAYTRSPTVNTRADGLVVGRQIVACSAQPVDEEPVEDEADDERKSELRAWREKLQNRVPRTTRVQQHANRGSDLQSHGAMMNRRRLRDGAIDLDPAGSPTGPKMIVVRSPSRTRVPEAEAEEADPRHGKEAVKRASCDASVSGSHASKSQHVEKSYRMTRSRCTMTRMCLRGD